MAVSSTSFQASETSQKLKNNLDITAILLNLHKSEEIEARIEANILEEMLILRQHNKEQRDTIRLLVEQYIEDNKTFDDIVDQEAVRKKISINTFKAESGSVVNIQ